MGLVLIKGAKNKFRTIHLWHTCFALWIAAASFFLGQSDVFPEPLRIMTLLCIPVLFVLLLMFYWLVRVLFTQWRPQSR
jgi:hypothetical protein